MADTIKLPGIGPTKKSYVYIGGALIAGIVGYAYWNASRSSEPEVVDYTTDDIEYAMDGSEDEYENPGGSSDPVNEDNLAAPSNNLEWSAAAQEWLTDNGADFMAVAAALGAYFTRKTLSPSQAEFIRSAWGRFGPPPQGDYPIKVSSTTPSAPLPTLTAPTGLSAHDIGRTTTGFLWNAVSGARWYELHRNGRIQSYNTSSTHVSMSGLKPNTRYTVKVRAVGMDKKPGPFSASRSFTTKR